MIASTPPLDAYRPHVDRVVLTLEKIRRRRYATSTVEIHREVLEDYGRCCYRSTLRDLQFLERLGLVRRHPVERKWLAVCGN